MEDAGSNKSEEADSKKPIKTNERESTNEKPRIVVSEPKSGIDETAEKNKANMFKKLLLEVHTILTVS